MTKVQLMTSVTRAFHKAGFQLKKHSPEILVATGVISTVAGAVLACKATLKVNDVMEEAKTNIDTIHASTEAGRTPGGQEYAIEDSKKDLALVYTQTGFKLIKLYAPAVILGAAGISCMLTSHNILQKRNGALAAAYMAVDKGFKEYRGRAVEKFGKEVDKELKYNIKKQEIEETVIDEKGKEKKIKKTVDVIDPSGEISEFARFFDESCPDWTKNAEYNKMFLRAQQTWANNILTARGYLFLNEVYKALGMDETEAGQVVGWIYDPENPNHKGDNYVDFGMCLQSGVELYDKQKRRFVNGLERTILLDFNVDGPILNKAFNR
jgi:hypothetical protein